MRWTILLTSALVLGCVFINVPSVAATTQSPPLSWWAVLTFGESLMPGKPLRAIFGPASTTKSCNDLRKIALETFSGDLPIVASSCKQLMQAKEGREYWALFIFDPAKVKGRLMMIFLGPAPNLAECGGLKKTALRTLQNRRVFKSKTCLRLSFVGL